jgi:LPXTG-motif cell wall-anchored protein
LGSGTYLLTETGIPEDFRFDGMKISNTFESIAEVLANTGQYNGVTVDSTDGALVIIFNRFVPNTVGVNIVKQVQQANGTWAESATFNGSRNLNYRIIVTGTPSSTGFAWKISGNVKDSKVALPNDGYFEISNANPSVTIVYSMLVAGAGKHENDASVDKVTLMDGGDEEYRPILGPMAKVTVTLTYDTGGGGETWQPTPQPQTPTPTTPPTTIPDPPTPLAPIPDVVIPPKQEVIVDEEVPLGNLPKTGKTEAGMFGLLGMGLTGLIARIKTKKKGDGEEP